MKREFGNIERKVRSGRKRGTKGAEDRYLFTIVELTKSSCKCITFKSPTREHLWSLYKCVNSSEVASEMQFSCLVFKEKTFAYSKNEEKAPAYSKNEENRTRWCKKNNNKKKKKHDLRTEI